MGARIRLYRWLAMPRCPECGYELEWDDDECPNCGAILGDYEEFSGFEE